MRSHLIPFSSYSRSLLFNSLTASSSCCRPHMFIGRCYGGNHGKQEIHRAPSTAEEFKRVAEEKLKQTEQGLASQTLEKTYDATEEATLGDSKVESVKERYKEHEPAGGRLPDEAR